LIVWNKGILKHGEAWYDEATDGASVDILLYLQYSKPPPGVQCFDKHTREVDLSVGSAKVIEGFDAATRNKVRRAGKDAIEYVAFPPAEVEGGLTEMIGFFDRFAASRGLASVDPTYLREAARMGILDLSRTRSSEGETLVWHSHLLLASRARLLHTGSAFRDQAEPALRSLVGRANRYTHWRDMMRHADMGLGLYDFGGWYVGESDQELLSINDFKKGFGGAVAAYYNGWGLMTYKGRAAMGLRAAAKKCIPVSAIRWARRMAMRGR
jgi:hypothetical protein